MSKQLFICLLSALLLAGGTCQAEVVDRSVAVVNNDIITLSEVNELGKPIFQKIAAEVAADQLDQALDEARKSLIEKLIDKKILLQEASKLQITVSDDEVDEAIKRILENNNATQEQFLAELQSMGLTLERYRDDLREQILSSRLVNYEVRSKVVIPEERIIDYYDNHYTNQVGDGGYYLLQIGCSIGEGNGRQQALDKANKVHGLAQQGQDFKDLARQYSDLPSASDGGDIGVFKPREMAEYMRQAVTSLEPGQISQVIETPSGFQIFKLLSSQEGEIVTKMPYESVKEDIRKTLYEQEMQARFDTWLKEMRTKAYIKIL